MVLDWIANGVHFPLLQPVPNFFHKPLPHEPEALTYWTQRLKPHYLASGAIISIAPPLKQHQYVSKCFFVPKSSGGYRLVVDLKFVNRFFEVHKIKFENLGMLRYAQQGLTFGAKVDLSDAYHHIKLHPSLQPYFQFTLNGEFFQCIAVPFGWCLAPFAYTKVMRPVITAMRNPHLPTSQGYDGKLNRLAPLTALYYVQIYIDDILLLATTADVHTAIIEALLDLLSSLGILYHPGKCELELAQSLDFLGMRLDIPSQRFLLTTKQKDRLRIKTTTLLAEANRQ